MLNKSNREKLTRRHIRIFDYADYIILSKKIGTEGNSIPNFKSSPIIVYNAEMQIQEEVFSDCPHVSIRQKDHQYIVSVWNWVPGPGPGDFELTFNTEEEAVTEALDYFFEENEYFNLALSALPAFR